jgi:hypothetical protein
MTVWQTGDDARSYWFGLKCDASPYAFQYYTYDGAAENYISGAVPSLGSNYRLVLVSSAGTCSLYINGSLAAGPTALPIPQSSSLEFQIGGQVDVAQHYKGVIDSFAILNGTAWSETEVLADYNSWVACDMADIYARRYASTPGTVTKLINEVSSEVAADSWPPAAGKYHAAANGFFYHRTTGDLPGNPGGWPQ